MPLLLSLFLNFLLLHSTASDRDLDSHRPRHKVKAVTQQTLSAGLPANNPPPPDPFDDDSEVGNDAGVVAPQASPVGASPAAADSPNWEKGDSDGDSDLAGASATSPADGDSDIGPDSAMPGASADAALDASGAAGVGSQDGDSDVDPDGVMADAPADAALDASDVAGVGAQDAPDPALPSDGDSDPASLDAGGELDATPSGQDNGVAADAAQDTASQPALDADPLAASADKADSEIDASPAAAPEEMPDSAPDASLVTPSAADPEAPKEGSADDDTATPNNSNEEDASDTATPKNFNEEDASGNTPSMIAANAATNPDEDSPQLDNQPSQTLGDTSPVGEDSDPEAANDMPAAGDLPDITASSDMGPAGSKIIEDDDSDGELPTGDSGGAIMPSVDDAQADADADMPKSLSSNEDEDVIALPGQGDSMDAEDNGPTEEEEHGRDMQAALNEKKDEDEAQPAAREPMTSPSQALSGSDDQVDNLEAGEDLPAASMENDDAQQEEAAQPSEMSTPPEPPAPVPENQSEESSGSGAGDDDEVSNLYKDTQKVVDRVSSAVDRAGNSITATKTAASSLLSNSASYDTALGKLSDNLRTFNVGVKSFREATAKKHEANTAKIGASLQSGLQAGLTAVER